VQIRQRLNEADLRRGWGVQHLRRRRDWETEYNRMRTVSTDLRTLSGPKLALEYCARLEGN
jgi:hypothetical protein